MITAAMVGFMIAVFAVMTWVCVRRRRTHRTNWAEQRRQNVARGQRIRDMKGLREVPRGYRNMAEEMEREQKGGGQ